MRYIVFIFICLLSTATLYGYTDSDLDGVDDAHDQCPNTPFSDLVDTTGCSIKSLEPLDHYDVIVGVSYTQSDYQTLNQTDTFSTSFQFDYYYKAYSFEFLTSYYTTSGSGYSDTGLNDTFLGVSYRTNITKALSIRYGLGVLLPTYDTTLHNNNTDYSATLNATYKYNKWNLFGAYTYTLLEDDDTVIYDTDGATIPICYQNTNAASFGVGYNSNATTYMSLTYNNSESIYTGVQNIQTASLYFYRSLDSHWFYTLSYAYGLSESASEHYLSLRCGYYF